MQIDHYHPAYVCELHKQDVDNSFENLMPACRSCNFYKSTFSVEGFRQRIAGIPERLKKEFIYNVATRYGIIDMKDEPIVFYFEKK
jgi:hypothetical protein